MVRVKCWHCKGQGEIETRVSEGKLLGLGEKTVVTECMLCTGTGLIEDTEGDDEQ